MSEVNPVREAIYRSELQALIVLQSINALLAAFNLNEFESYNMCLFILSEVFFISGVISAVVGIIKTGEYIEERFKGNTGGNASKKWLFLVYCSLTFFVLGIILSIIGLMLS